MNNNVSHFTTFSIERVTVSDENGELNNINKKAKNSIKHNLCQEIIKRSNKEFYLYSIKCVFP